MRTLQILWTLGTMCGASACAPTPPPLASATLTALRTDIFEARCSATVCHGGPNPAAGLNLVNAATLYASLVDAASSADPAMLRVKADEPDSSLLYTALLGPVGATSQMPQGGELSADEKDQVKRWISDGAKDN